MQAKTEPCPDLSIDHLLPHQKVIAKAVLRAVGKGATGGGCRAFYCPKEWKQRGEHYGHGSLLIVVHDGGDLAPYCNLDYQNYKLHERMVRELSAIGLYMEQCTSWYSAIYTA